MNNSLKFNLIALTVSLSLAACQKQPDAPEQHGPNGKLAAQAVQVSPTSVNNMTANQADSESANANSTDIKSQQVSPLNVKIVPANVKIPACKGKSCSDIEIKQVDSNDAWVNQFFANEVLKLSYPMGEGKPTSLQASVDKLLKDSGEDAKMRGNPVPYELKIEPEYLGERAGISRFKIDASFYTGGAHGGAFENYYNLDRAAKKQLNVDDIVINGQKQKLHDLVHEKFAAWVKQSDPNANIAEYEKGWAFNLTDNFSFENDGLDFQYQQYEIGPYASGMPDFTVPYSQLKGIIKPQYL